MADARIVIPGQVRRGEPFEVRVLVRHAMETGYRMDESGRSIPRNVIRDFTCRYDGEIVFAARLSSGIAANPYLRFFLTGKESGELAFEWIDDSGARFTERVAVTVA